MKGALTVQEMERRKTALVRVNRLIDAIHAALEVMETDPSAAAAILRQAIEANDA